MKKPSKKAIKENKKEIKEQGVTKKNSTADKSPKSAESGSRPPSKKESATPVKSSSKPIAPPPTGSDAPARRKSTLNGKKEENDKKAQIAVDVSKFVTEAKGDIQDRYLVQAVIGKGAYGEVRMVKDKITHDLRAMKVIPKESCSGTSSAAINNEIQVLKSLDHPNIIKIYEFYQDDINYYLITEFCSGGELYDRIIAMKNFCEAKAAQLMKQILSAVTYCHSRKIVHRYFLLHVKIKRDIKPENLLFESPDEEANLKVIDFGTSIIFETKKMRQKLGTVFFLLSLKKAILYCSRSTHEIL